MDHPDEEVNEEARQPDRIDAGAMRSLLDQLLSDSRLYRNGKDYKDLLDFVVRLRNFAPFNAMLLHVQKPGLSYAASAEDWLKRFGRVPKEGARPLLILWPFAPVALVYDVIDTEGERLPEDVAQFVARGPICEEQILTFRNLVEKKNIEWRWVDAGDGSAGSIRPVKRATNPEDYTQYRIHINRNHTPPVHFATLAHELAHLFLGHLGPDKKLSIPARHAIGHHQRELEAESVAYLVCARNGVASKSETYLSNFVETNTTIDHIELYQVMRAAGRVEATLELSGNAK